MNWVVAGKGYPMRRWGTRQQLLEPSIPGQALLLIWERLSRNKLSDDKDSHPYVYGVGDIFLL
jgi:hypothetical protein